MASAKIDVVANSKEAKASELDGDNTWPEAKHLAARPGSVWYFAFGSNMNAKTLTGRRKVVPSSSLTSILHGYKLTFNHKGVPYWEPGFATILPGDREKDAVHGIVHEVTLEEWEVVKVTEGVTEASIKKGSSYLPREVRCRLYDGRWVQAMTLMSGPKHLHPPSRGEVQPSPRYLNLILNGAAAHTLEAQYMTQLDSLRPYRRSPKQAAGYFLIMSIAFLLALPILPLVFLLVAPRLLYSFIGPVGPVNPHSSLYMLVSGYAHRIMSLLWVLHDVILMHVFGSGCHGEVESGLKKHA